MREVTVEELDSLNALAVVLVGASDPRFGGIVIQKENPGHAEWRMAGQSDPVNIQYVLHRASALDVPMDLFLIYEGVAPEDLKHTEELFEQ